MVALLLLNEFSRTKFQFLSSDGLSSNVLAAFLCRASIHSTLYNYLGEYPSARLWLGSGIARINEDLSLRLDTQIKSVL